MADGFSKRNRSWGTRTSVSTKIEDDMAKCVSALRGQVRLVNPPTSCLWRKTTDLLAFFSVSCRCCCCCCCFCRRIEISNVVVARPPRLSEKVPSRLFVACACSVQSDALGFGPFRFIKRSEGVRAGVVPVPLLHYYHIFDGSIPPPPFPLSPLVIVDAAPTFFILLNLVGEEGKGWRNQV